MQAHLAVVALGMLVLAHPAFARIDLSAELPNGTAIAESFRDASPFGVTVEPYNTAGCILYPISIPRDARHCDFTSMAENKTNEHSHASLANFTCTALILSWTSKLQNACRNTDAMAFAAEALNSTLADQGYPPIARFVYFIPQAESLSPFSVVSPERPAEEVSRNKSQPLAYATAYSMAYKEDHARYQQFIKQAESTGAPISVDLLFDNNPFNVVLDSLWMSIVRYVFGSINLLGAIYGVRELVIGRLRGTLTARSKPLMYALAICSAATYGASLLVSMRLVAFAALDAAGRFLHILVVNLILLLWLHMLEVNRLEKSTRHFQGVIVACIVISLIHNFGKILGAAGLKSADAIISTAMTILLLPAQALRGIIFFYCLLGFLSKRSTSDIQPSTRQILNRISAIALIEFASTIIGFITNAVLLASPRITEIPAAVAAILVLRYVTQTTVRMSIVILFSVHRSVHAKDAPVISDRPREVKTTGKIVYE